jgi:hypothetical protein
MKDSVCYAPMVMWCYNYDYDFIDVVWEQDKHMCNHLKNKWKDYLDTLRDSARAMLKFYANLDGKNQRMLDAHIYRKYKHMHEWAGEFYSDTTPTE